MKNTHRGFILPLLLIVIAALLAGGGYLYTQNQTLSESIKSDTQATSTTPAKVVKNIPESTPTPMATLPSTCTSVSTGEPGNPVITSISKTSGPLGTQLEIKGCNFSGFEGQKTVWIENSQGVVGMLNEDSSSTNSLLKAKLESPLCSEDNSFSGKPCTSELNLTPGTYKIFKRPWGKKSNPVTFTVTTPSITLASSCGMTINSPAKNAKVSFPLTISGVIDNRNSAALGCSWVKFEGEAGSVQLYFRGSATSEWSKLGSPVVVSLSGSNWMTAGPVPFSVTLNFNNDGIGLGGTEIGGTRMKAVFSDNQQKENTPSSTLELPFVF